MTRKTYPQRLAAAVGALTIAMVGFAGVANANLGTDGTPPGNAPAGTTGQLTIHKRVDSPGAAGNGTVLDPAPGIPLGGITFNVQRVGISNAALECVAIDLSTTEGWAAVGGTPPQGSNPAAPVATPTAAGQLCNFGAATPTAATDNTTGITTAPNLALGLYYVTENASAPVTALAVPFYVTIPYNSVTTVGDEDVTTWLYDVNVYPKNSISGDPSKTLDDVEGAIVGQNGAVASWTLTSPVLGSTRLPANSTAVTVTDRLGECLAYVAGSGQLTVKVPGSADATSAIAPTFAEGTNNATFTHTFPTTGYPAGTSFVITYDTTVTCVDDTEGSTWNDSDWGQDVSWWGELEVTKQDATNDALLNGAEFALYAGACPANEADLPAAPITTGATVDGKWTTAGLYVGKGEAAETSTASYCLVETKAPHGYVQPTWANNHQTVVIEPGKVASTEVEGEIVVTGNYTVVDNTPIDGPDLPLTGAQGTMIFSIVGAAVILTAGGLMIRRTRKVNS